MSPAAADLAVVIVSYNARADLVRCLETLHVPAPRMALEIVVVDNRSTDGSVEALRAFPHVRVVDAGSNVGFARGCNIGIRVTTAETIVLLNSDTVVPPGALEGLVAELRADPAVAVVGPRLVDAAGRPEVSFGRMIGPLNELRQRRLMRAYAAGRRWACEFVGRWTSRRHTPDWVSGACLMVRRTDAEAVGLLDERYFMYTEDVDFCAAIRAKGRSVLFTPAVEVVHLRGRSVASAPEATRLAYRRSHLAFYRKHHPAWLPVLALYLGLRGDR